MTTSNKVTVDCTAFMIVALVLVVLKIAGTLDISWWWVLAPALIPLAFIQLLIMVSVLLNMIGETKASVVINNVKDRSNLCQ